MKRNLVIAIIIFVSTGLGFISGAVSQPKQVRAFWIKLFSNSVWERNNRLGSLLELGMTPSQVRSMLGRPTSEKAMSEGIQWNYWDGIHTAGNNLIIEFKQTVGPKFVSLETLRLCFVQQDHESHQLVPDNKYYTLGERLDN